MKLAPISLVKAAVYSVVLQQSLLLWNATMLNYLTPLLPIWGALPYSETLDVLVMCQQLTVVLKGRSTHSCLFFSCNSVVIRTLYTFRVIFWEVFC